MSKYWMVYRIDGATPPRHKHSSYAFALAEAQRLAALNGGEFAVLEVISISQQEVTTTVKTTVLS